MQAEAFLGRDHPAGDCELDEALPSAVQAGLLQGFPFSEYEAMAELMRSAAGRFVVSINDHPQIGEVFAGFDWVPLQLDYTIGGGQGRGRKFGELIIKSWDDRQSALL